MLTGNDHGKRGKRMTKRTVWLLVAALLLIAACILCLLLIMKDNGLMGSGVYFVFAGAGR